MITITLAAQKGGVAKTTTAEALILGLRRKGFKVLGIDLDSQGNLTTFLNPKADLDAFDLLDGKADPKECIQNDLIAGGQRLGYLTQFLDQNGILALKEKLDSLNLDYDFCIIDTPPALGKTLYAAIATSNYVIIPTEPTNESMVGVNQTCKVIGSTQKANLSQAVLLGVLLIKYKERYKNHKEFKDKLDADDFPLFKTTIRESQAINNAKRKTEDFYGKEYMHANAVQDYRKFVNEVLDKIGVKK